MIGKILGNRYKIVEKIGDGGTAFVFKGLDTILNRHVTVKVLRPEYAGDQDFVRRFRREAQAAAGLSHPNIVSVYDVGHENGIHYIVMEYVQGRSLKALIEETGRLNVYTAAEYAAHIALALSHAHKHGIIHRDVKPHNILISDDGRVKVTDFGIAQAVTASTLTYSGEILGSVHYFSPEQARGGATDEKSDIYSLGIVLYEMLTGRLPYSGESPVSIAVKHLQEPFPDPEEINPQIPRALCRIVRKAVEKDPQNRFQTAREMAAALNEWLHENKAEFSTIVRPSMHKTEKQTNLRSPKTKKRRLKPVYLAGVLALIIVLIILAYTATRLLQIFAVPDVIVPDVEGELQSQAFAILEEAGLVPRLEDQIPSETVPSGYVISQNPKEGRTVKKGREVALIISTGPELVSVDNVVGMQRRPAELKLEDSGFNVEVIEEYSDEPQGIVISQDPGANHKIPKGSTVKIVVSKGSKPIELVDLTGRTLEDAENWLQLFGLIPRKTSEEYSDQYPAGYVIDQFPEPGEELQAGDYVDLVISKGPEEPQLEKHNITIMTADIPPGEIITVIISDEMGDREETYVSDGNPIETVGWGSGIVEVRWGNHIEVKAFP